MILLHADNYLHNIYIVLGIMNNLEMIGSIQEDVPRLLCKYYAILFEELEIPKSVDFGIHGSRRISLPRILRDDCVVVDV